MPVRAILEHSRYPWHIPLLELFYQLRGGVFHHTSWNKGYSHAVSGRDLWDY